MHSVDQERLLSEACASVKHCAIQMEKCLDKGDMMDAMGHAADMLREMKTSYLSPKSYYELYMIVTEKLRLLESQLVELRKRGSHVGNLYEKVQYEPNMVSRLYLMITVGVYHIKCAEFSRREILRDLVDMCRGVQHPLRGLFLRNYLLHALRTELLPVNEDPIFLKNGHHPSNNTTNPSTINGSTVQGDSSLEVIVSSTNAQGSISDTVDFLLLNFAEMNKLWVRMQHQGHSRDRERREQERRELRLLVGTNLNRIAQLEVIDVERYKSQILPPILEQLIECRDVIAQECLMDVIIQVFPAEFHMATLLSLLNTCGQLQPGVKLRQIVCSLVVRLIDAISQDYALTLCNLITPFSLSQYALNEASAEVPSPVPVLHSNQPDIVPSTPTAVATEDGTEKSNGSLADQDSSSQPDVLSIFFDGLRQLLDARLYSARKLASSVSAGATRYPPTLVDTAVTACGLPPEDIPALYSSLVYLAMLLYPDKSPALVDACLSAAADYLTRIGITQVSPVSPLSRELLNLLHLPLDGASPPTASSHHHHHQMAHIGHNTIPSVPLGALGELRTVLSMPGFRQLVALLDPRTTKRRFACNLLTSALEREQRQSRDGEESGPTPPSNLCRLTSEADVEGMFDLIGSLLTPDAVTNADDPEEFTELQTLVAGAMHLIGPVPRSEAPELCLTLLRKARDLLTPAGPIVIRFNYPALVFEGFQLIEAYGELEKSTFGDHWDDCVLQAVTFVHQCITKLVACNAAEIALRLSLKAALVTDRIPFAKREAMAYEFVSQALTLYEGIYDAVHESRARVAVFNLITDTMHQMRCFSPDNCSTLRDACARASRHLLRKHDQCRAVATAAHLFWPVCPFERHGVKPTVMLNLTDRKEQMSCHVTTTTDVKSSEELDKLRDGKKVMEGLNRALNLAHDCMDATVQSELYMDILNQAITLRIAGCMDITDDWINQIIASVQKQLIELRRDGSPTELDHYLVNTLNFIRTCRDRPVNGNSATKTEAALEDDVAQLFATVQIE